MSHCLNAGGMGRIDYETETMIVCATGEVVHCPDVAGTMKACKESGGRSNSADHAAAGYMIPVLAFHSNAQPDEMKFDEHVSAPLTCSQYSAVAVRDVSPTLTGNYGKQVDNSDTALGPNVVLQRDAVAFHENQRGEVTVRDTAGTVKCAGGKPGQGYLAALVGMRVRRLTPRECERLQGFPDRYTAIPKAKDGPRYKALGNSMAVPVMRWIGQQIDYAMIWSTP